MNSLSLLASGPFALLLVHCAEALDVTLPDPMECEQAAACEDGGMRVPVRCEDPDSGCMTLPDGAVVPPPPTCMGECTPPPADAAGNGGSPGVPSPDGGGSGGSGGGEGCVPTAERCNGEDDDCDGVADNGCPSGVVVAAASETSPDFGDMGGGEFTSPCGAGQALTGFDIRYSTGSNGEIRQLRPECSTLVIVPREGTNETAFDVHTVDPILLANRGNTSSGSLDEDRCPENQIVLGVRGRVVDELRRFGFTCGSLAVTRASDTGRWQLTVGPATFSSPERGRDAGSGDFTYDCPSGTGATVLSGRSGDRIDLMTISCSPMSLLTL